MTNGAEQSSHTELCAGGNLGYDQGTLDSAEREREDFGMVMLEHLTIHLGEGHGS